MVFGSVHITFLQLFAPPPPLSKTVCMSILWKQFMLRWIVASWNSLSETISIGHTCTCFLCTTNGNATKTSSYKFLNAQHSNEMQGDRLYQKQYQFAGISGEILVFNHQLLTMPSCWVHCIYSPIVFLLSLFLEDMQNKFDFGQWKWFSHINHTKYSATRCRTFWITHLPRYE